MKEGKKGEKADSSCPDCGMNVLCLMEVKVRSVGLEESSTGRSFLLFVLAGLFLLLIFRTLQLGP